jgi:hypothetical protein
LNVREVPYHIPIIVGSPVKISLRGVVGFGDIIIRIVTTLDAEIACCIQAEQEIINRLAEFQSIKGKGSISLKKDLEGRKNQIKRLMGQLDFPEPIETIEIENLLLGARLLQKNF